MTTGIIIGVVIGVVVAIALAVVVVYFVFYSPSSNKPLGKQEISSSVNGNINSV